jgi:hypothetical protein
VIKVVLVAEIGVVVVVAVRVVVAESEIVAVSRDGEKETRSGWYEWRGG